MQIPKHYKKNCFAKKIQTLQKSLCYNILLIQRKIFKNFFLKKIKKTQKRYGKLLMQSLITENTKKSWQISSYINNVFTTDDKAIANHFNKFFTSIPYKLKTKILQTNCTYHDYLKIQMKNPCLCIQ